MFGKKLWLFGLIAVLRLCDAADFVEVPAQDKLRDADLTFAVTFDRNTVEADLARGNPVSPTMKDVGLLLRGCVGFDGGNAFQVKPGDDLRFDVPGNASPAAGTITIWVNALGYNPAEALTDGEHRGNIALFDLMFKEDSRFVRIRAYEYGDTVYAFWESSEEPQGWGQYTQLPAPRTAIRKNQWHQLAVTWTDRTMALYLNGELQREADLPPKSLKTADLQPQSEESYIGLKTVFYEDTSRWPMAIDDVKIYSRALKPIEIRNAYAALLKERGDIVIQDYDLTLNGVSVSRADKLDRLEAEFDFSVLPPELKSRLEAGTLEIAYGLTAPDGTVREGTWQFRQGESCRILDAVDQVGAYRLACSIDGGSRVAAVIERPDLSWVGNGLGDEDEIPALWRDFAVDGRRVTLWNRTYDFADRPLPVSIRVAGKELFTQAPQLHLDGRAIAWQPLPTTRTGRSVTFHTRGEAEDLVIVCATTVEFDGMIQFEWTISGEPEIASMNLTWQMAPEFRQYLMTPWLQNGAEPQVALEYPASSASSVKTLWFVTEKRGGFAYTMEHNANWVADFTRPVFFADKADGSCRVQMIDRKVKLPPETDYHALFIATPTRPLPERNRVIRFGDSSRADTPRLAAAGGGDGLSGVFTYEPLDPDFTYCMKGRVPNTQSFYGAADSLTEQSPVANYFRKYWDIPGCDIYKMRYLKPTSVPGQYEETWPVTVPACTRLVINDYYLFNQRKLLEHPLGDRVWQLYYDLGGDSMCFNPLHGCRFKDKFGRDVYRLAVLSKRDLFRRTVTQAHKYGKTVMVHAQREFLPFMHGLADYFFPGEQHNGLLQRNRFGYTDELSDDTYRSEYNRDVLGVGVIFLPAIGHVIKDYWSEEAKPVTVSMMTMLLAHDIDTAEDWATNVVIQKVWDALEKYRVGSPDTECIPYYAEHAISTSEPSVRVTTYRCPGGRYVLILANKDARSHTAEVDIGSLTGESFTAQEEYAGAPVEVVGGKFQIKVPARSFRIVAFPPIGFYPVADAFDAPWGSWAGDDAAAMELRLDDAVGRSAAPSLLLRAADSANGCFLKSFPVTPGRKYRASVWVRQENAAAAILAFQWQRDSAFAGLPVVSSRSEYADGWRRMELEFALPAEGEYAGVNMLLVTLSVEGEPSKSWFDDFLLEEEE